MKRYLNFTLLLIMGFLILPAISVAEKVDFDIGEVLINWTQTGGSPAEEFVSVCAPIDGGAAIEKSFAVTTVKLSIIPDLVPDKKTYNCFVQVNNQYGNGPASNNINLEHQALGTAPEGTIQLQITGGTISAVIVPSQ